MQGAGAVEHERDGYQTQGVGVRHIEAEVGHPGAIGLHRSEPGVVELRRHCRIANLQVVVTRLDQPGTEVDGRAPVNDHVDDRGLIDELGHATDEDRGVARTGQVEW